MAACVIDGARCTACCQAIGLHSKRHNLRKAALRGVWGDVQFVAANWKPISWRRAKKRNPYIATTMVKTAKSYWVCKQLTPTGCGAYLDRPNVCRGFPRYGNSPEVFNDRVRSHAPEYHPRCTEWQLIAVQ